MSSSGGTYFFDTLPEPLHLECATFLHRDVVENVALFKGTSESFLREVMMNLHPQVCTPNEYVVNSGDVARAMFYISRGTVAVLREYEVIGHLSAGDYFGDMAILMGGRRSRSVRAETFCDLFLLEADRLQILLSTYGSDLDVVHANACELRGKKERQGLSSRLNVLERGASS